MNPSISLLFIILLVQLCASKKPHIIILVGDDVGWHDLGYHDSEIPTPGIDSIASEGVKLENYYTQSFCSPTRSALLTGRYPSRYGLQHLIINPIGLNSIPLTEKLLPEWLKSAGYATHAIGKWHLGSGAWEQTPTYRGFDTFFGYLGGAVDYYTSKSCDDPATPACGFDLRDGAGRNPLPLGSTQGDTYNGYYYTQRAIEIVNEHDQSKPLFMYFAPEHIHTPMQVPQYYKDQFCSHITNTTRKTHCAMVSFLDEIVKNFTDALKDNGMWKDTLFVFTSDNGGEIYNPAYFDDNLPENVQRGSHSVNWPLRGTKGTYFEGGIRAVSFLNWNGFKTRGIHQYNGLMHVTDLFTTILDIANINYAHSPNHLDGISHKHALLTGAASPRKEFLISYNPNDFLGYEGIMVPMRFNGAYRKGDLKLIVAESNSVYLVTTDYVPPSDMDPSVTTPCSTFSYDKSRGVHLFNVTADPSECVDILRGNELLAFELLQDLHKFAPEAQYPQPVGIDSCPCSSYGGNLTPCIVL